MTPGKGRRQSRTPCIQRSGFEPETAHSHRLAPLYRATEGLPFTTMTHSTQQDSLCRLMSGSVHHNRVAYLHLRRKPIGTFEVPLARSHDLMGGDITNMATADEDGFEPSHQGFKVPCLTAWLFACNPLKYHHSQRLVVDLVRASPRIIKCRPDTRQKSHPQI